MFTVLEPLFQGLHSTSENAALDVGCGRIGAFTRLLAKHFDRVEAIDLDEEAVKKCGEVLSDLPNVKVRREEAHKTGFPESSFDAVFLFRTLHFIRDVPGFFEEVDRILAPGGKLVVISSPLFTLQPKKLDEILVRFCHETFELKDYWNSETTKNFLQFCYSERENAASSFPYIEYESHTLKDKLNFNILDLESELMQFNVASRYLETRGLNEYKEKIRLLQSELMHALEREMSEMYFENVMLTKETTFYVQINTKPE